jgi:hypothetical protein
MQRGDAQPAAVAVEQPKQRPREVEGRGRGQTEAESGRLRRPNSRLSQALGEGQ